MKTITFTIVNELKFDVHYNSDLTIRKFIEKNKHLHHNSANKKTYYFVKRMDRFVVDFDTKLKDIVKKINDDFHVFVSPPAIDIVNGEYDVVYGDDIDTYDLDENVIKSMHCDNHYNDYGNDGDDDDDDNDYAERHFKRHQYDFFDFNGIVSYSGPKSNALLRNTSYIDFVVKIKETVTVEISDTDFDQPIINTLENKEIDKACWLAYIDSSESYEKINVDKPFNYYDSTNYVGFTTHTEQCKKNGYCDLIEFQSIRDNCLYSTKYRFVDCNYKIIVSGVVDEKQYKMKVPVECDRDIILNTFIKNNAMYEDFDNASIELYYAGTKYIDSDVALPITDEYSSICGDYYDHENDEGIPFDEDYTYVIVLRIKKQQLRHMMARKVPKDIADIIFTYIDSMEAPLICDIFPSL
jgi:hypothetical protein